MSLDTRVVTGAERLKRRLSAIRTTLQLPALTNEIGLLLLRRMQDRYDREVDPEGERWVPLARKTVLDKQRLGVGSKGILKRTDELRHAIQIIRGSVAGTMFTNTGGGVRIGVSGPPKVVSRGRAHQRGVPQKHLPQRRFLGIGSLDVRSVDSMLRRKAVDIERT
jgi:hypothetical protein